MEERAIDGYSWWLWELPKFREYIKTSKEVKAPEDTQEVWKDVEEPDQTKEELLSAYEKGMVFYAYIANKLREMSCDSILDMGCGKGYFLKYLQDNCSDIAIAGTDFNKKRIELAKKITNAEIKREDILKGLSLNNNSFDAVTCLAFLPCFNDNQIDFVLKELVRVSKKYIIIYEDTRNVSGVKTNHGRPNIVEYFLDLPIMPVFQSYLSMPYMDKTELEFFDGWYGFPKRMITIFKKIG